MNLKKSTLKMAFMFLMLIFVQFTNAQEPFCSDDVFTDIKQISENTSSDIVLSNGKTYWLNWESKTVNEFNISTGDVKVLSTTSTNYPSKGSSLTEYGGYLYAFGGNNTSNNQWVAGNAAKRYNLSTNLWETLPVLPTSVDQASAVTMNGKIYILGSYYNTTSNISYNYFYEFNPSTNNYKNYTNPLSTKVINSKLVVYNNIIYRIGGRTINGLGDQWANSKDVWSFDTKSISWTSVGFMPSAISDVSATIMGKYLYVFGGVTKYSIYDKDKIYSYKYFVYDFENNTWITSTKTMEKSIEAGSAVTFNNSIYIFNKTSIVKYYCASNLGYNTSTYNNTVSVYPNPAKDYITIDCGEIANVVDWNIKIHNSLGQLVLDQQMNTQQYVVPLNILGEGVYFVKIYDAQGNEVITKKIIL